MKLEHNGETYTVEQVTGDVYRIYNKDTAIVITVEWRNGSYFKFRSASYNGRSYSAQRYSYKWISLMREATFLIAQTDGLYDYEHDGWHYFRNGGWV